MESCEQLHTQGRTHERMQPLLGAMSASTPWPVLLQPWPFRRQGRPHGPWRQVTERFLHLQLETKPKQWQGNGCTFCWSPCESCAHGTMRMEESAVPPEAVTGPWQHPYTPNTMRWLNSKIFYPLSKFSFQALALQCFSLSRKWLWTKVSAKWLSLIEAPAPTTSRVGSFWPSSFWHVFNNMF